LSTPVLAVRNLTTAFRVDGVWTSVVKNVSFEIAPRETVAIVGESGSGKSVHVLAMLGLIPRPPGRITGGQVLFPPSIEEVSTSFKTIEEELRSQYALIYTPADFKADGAFRTIYLYCNDRRYQVRAKKGYFAPRE